MVWSRNYRIKQVLFCAITLIMIANASSNGNQSPVPVKLAEPGSSLQGENDFVPSKVTGQGIYEHFYVENPETGAEWYPSDEEVGLFSIRIDPNGTSPQAVIRVDGVALREVWGGALDLQADVVACIPSQAYRPEDLKVGQTFVFFTQHPVLGQVQVALYVHDNCTPGYNTAESPGWSDWFSLVIEPLDGDGEPGTEDDLFNSVGIVTSGNIMDHRLEETEHVPSRVTGEGIYEHFLVENPETGGEWYPSDEEVGLFSIRIDPDGMSPQAIIRLDGVALREVWGGPLALYQDFVACIPSEPYRPEDVKPGQTFVFHTQHPVLGEVQVAAYIHDNCTPGYNTAESPGWSDWFSLVIEPLDGDGEPGTEDDLFNSVGIVTSGDIMDHRQ